VDEIGELDRAVASGHYKSAWTHKNGRLDRPLFMAILPSSISSWLKQMRTVSFLRFPRTGVSVDMSEDNVRTDHGITSAVRILRDSVRLDCT